MRTAIATDGRVWGAEGRYHLPCRDLAPVALRAAQRQITDLLYDPADIPVPEALPDGYIDERGNGRMTTPHGSVFVHNIATSPWYAQDYHGALQDRYHTLMRDYDALKGALTVRYLGFSPAWRGVQMVGAKRQRHPDWFHVEHPPERSEDAAPDYCRPLSFADRGQWLHAYDRRRAYLAVARTVPCGIGPVAFVKTFDPNRVGVWQVLTTSRIPRGMPACQPGWYNTASIRAAMARGSAIAVTGGYVWERHCYPFRSFCDAIGRASVTAYHHPLPLATLTKRLYTRTFGAFGQNRGKPGDWRYQPYWWRAIVAESARRLWADIGNDPYVIATETDKVFRVSASPDPAGYAPWDTKRDGGPGTWRHEGAYPIDHALIRATEQESGAVLAKHVRDNGYRAVGVAA